MRDWCAESLKNRLSYSRRCAVITWNDAAGISGHAEVFMGKERVQAWLFMALICHLFGKHHRTLDRVLRMWQDRKGLVRSKSS